MISLRGKPDITSARCCWRRLFHYFAFSSLRADLLYRPSLFLPVLSADFLLEQQQTYCNVSVGDNNESNKYAKDNVNKDVYSSRTRYPWWNASLQTLKHANFRSLYTLSIQPRCIRKTSETVPIFWWKKTFCIFESTWTYAHLNNISICILARIYTCWLTFVDASLGWAYWVRAATRSTISLIVNAKLQIDGATSTSTLSDTVLLFNTVSVPTLFYTEEKWWQNVRLSSALFGE